MATYILAISGGVDSVVLLDMFAKTDHRLVVAHVDHGIREDSSHDARFVEALSKKYNLPFATKRYELGRTASEETAREARYTFLFEKAQELGASIVTAHHADDMVETIALNLSRGTGWRGLAVLNRPGIHRPLLMLTKADIYDYALRHHLEWVEDSTNHSTVYTRNRLRARLAHHPSPTRTKQLYDLRTAQLQLSKEINGHASKLCAKHYGNRHFLTQLDEEVAIELLGSMMEQEVGYRPMRPQLVRLLLAIKTARAGTTCDVANGIKMMFTTRNYRLSIV